MTGRLARLTDAAYAAALALYPRAFRARYADDMRAFVRAQLRLPAYAGWRAILLWPRLAFDLARTIPRARLESLSDATRGQALNTFDVTEDWRRYPEEEIMDVLLHDARYALRTLRRRRSYAITAILTLALGIGATTAIFSVVNAVLLRPLPLPDADRVVLLWTQPKGTTDHGLAAYSDMVQWRQRSRSFESIGIMRGMSVNLTGGETPDRLSGMFADAETFAILGAHTSRGRTFTADEAQPGSGAAVAVLSYETWQTRFGGTPDIIGRTLQLNARPTTVIGVLSPGFFKLMGGSDVWLPISSIPTQQTFQQGYANVWGVGRLRTGTSVDVATRELDAIADDLARDTPANRGIGVAVVPMREQIVGTLRGALLTIFAAVALLLVIACANVANLQLARASSRVHEIAMRTALGAAAGRIVRQMLTESAILALLGAALGVVLARWALTALLALVPGGLPTFGDVTLDGTAMFFALGASAVSVLLFGLVPAMRASHADLRAGLGARGTTSSGAALRGGATITVVQLALCTALLIVAGLLTRSLQQLRAVSPGFDPSNMLGAEFRLPPTRYPTDSVRDLFFARVLAELRATPGVTGAALAGSLPLTGNFGMTTYEVEGRANPPVERQPQSYIGGVTDGYFSTMHIPLFAGRDFSATDNRNAPLVVVVNQTLAHREWPGESAIGKRIRPTGDTVWSTVIGVAGDSREMTLAEAQSARIYESFRQSSGLFATVAMRTAGDPSRYADALRHAIWAVDRDQPVWRVRPLTAYVEMSTQQQRFTTILTISFAVLSLLLGAIGVYGVMSYSVAQRTRELGLRVAVGATRARVMRLVLGNVLRLSAMAVALGAVVAALFSRALSSQLYGVTSHDPVTFAVVPLVLLVIAIAAACAPALRASRVDPMIALRAE